MKPTIGKVCVLATFVTACAVALGSPAEAVQARRPLSADDLYAVREVGEPSLSPDGAWVAWSVTTLERDDDQKQSDLAMAPTSGGDPIRLTRDPKTSDWRPRFSPDGRWLGFLSDRTGKTQVWVLDRRGGEPARLTELAGGVTGFSWSPDSSRLVLVAKDAEAGDAQGESKSRPRPIVVDRLQFKVDGSGFLSERRKHLWLFDLASKSAVQLTRGAYDDSEPAWSPDGRRLAFASNRTEEPDSNYDSDIFVIDARPGAVPRRVSATGFADSSPVWSPDGRWLAWVEGGEPKEIYYATSHVAIAPFTGLVEAAASEPRALTRELDRNVYSPRFAADGSSVLFYYEDHGNQPLGAVSLAGGVIEEIAGVERHVSDFEVGRDGSVILLEATVARPAEISILESGGTRWISHENDELLATLELAPVERFTVQNAEGLPIEGFLFRPPFATPGERLPALLRIHGGPVDQFSSEFNFERQLMAARGYLVIAANPRGSSGRGRDFAYAIWADWGNKDYDDLMAAVDHAIAIGVADPDRLGVYGWSYGGILTNYVITKSGRFKAAMSGAGESNYLAGYGHDEYQREWEAELGLPWKESAKWVELSPFFDVESITTPTLFVCGQDDWNVPLINSEQMYQALRRLGKPTGLVIYPGEDHSIERPSFQKDRLERYLAWFDRYVLGKEPRTKVGESFEATSLLGAPLAAPAISSSTRETLEANLLAAQGELARSPGSADAAIWVGRRLGYLGRYREAIEVYTKALEAHPDDVRLLRHRGHRYLTVRELDLAVADLERAARLIREKAIPDEIEADGAPNDLGIATSTLHFNVWYHLGLAHYLKGEFELAAQSYRACLQTAIATPSKPGAAAPPAAEAAPTAASPEAAVSPTPRVRPDGTGDRLVAATDWLWLSLMRLDHREEAAAALAAVRSEAEMIEDQTYLDRVRFYKGELAPEELLAAADGAVDVATRSYAVGARYLIHGDVESARTQFERTLVNSRWDSFAVLAAEAELARMK